MGANEFQILADLDQKRRHVWVRFSLIRFEIPPTLFFKNFGSEEKDCLKQARGSAAAIRDLIHENCGRRDWVTPIVVFVGDWKIRNKWRDTNVRVFTPEQLLRYFGDQQPQLRRSEIQFIASHLERSVKT